MHIVSASILCRSALSTHRLNNVKKNDIQYKPIGRNTDYQARGSKTKLQVCDHTSLMNRNGGIPSVVANDDTLTPFSTSLSDLTPVSGPSTPAASSWLRVMALATT